ncbi:MAG: hypothetical protein LBU79_07860 [Planctomycetota bacterium]|jgi:ribosomal protein L7/L12|nr:hypothetical protein [Planctomycetota bacterium]
MDGKNFQIILDSVEEEKQPATALFLSGCFSLPPTSTKRIAASGPIAILSGLDGVQVEAILSELNPSLPEGVGLRVADDNEAGDVSRLEWPRPPKIFGCSLEEFAKPLEESVTTCPVCRSRLKISRGGDGRFGVTSLNSHNSSIMIPNPESVDGDRDPLFSGFKPLAAETAGLASIRSLQAGDTGFWGDLRDSDMLDDAPEVNNPVDAPQPRDKSASSTGGMSSYMKPGVFALVISRTKDAAVVKNVAEIMGVTIAIARDKCLGLSTCVARNISLSEAQTLLARFRGLGARARIVKPM